MNGLGVEAICFDYYGTLVDIGKPFRKIKKWFESFILMEKSNVPLESFNIFFNKQRAKFSYGKKFLTGHDILEKSYINSCDKYNIKPHVDEFHIFVDDLFRSALAFEHSLEIIETLRKNYLVGLLTNADNYLLHESIHNQGFSFQYIMSSEDAGSNKPDMGIYTYALMKLGLQPNRILMVGDSLTNDILAAQSMGFKTIWFNPDNEVSSEDMIQIKQIKDILYYV